MDDVGAVIRSILIVDDDPSLLANSPAAAVMLH
jgi:hypothetical protein